jgi:predicted negative regulator of RcsB-dependent stress response
MREGRYSGRATEFKMKVIAFLLAVVSFATGLLAAWYWYRSSQVAVKQTNKEAKSYDSITLGLLRRAIEAYQEVATLNKKAALWTITTVVLTAASAVAGAWPTAN